MENKIKKATYNFIEAILKKGYQPISIEYFEEGSVIHFYIKEMPDWKFGIWWDLNNNYGKSISGTFFAQSIIDKFKPTYAMLKTDFIFDIEDDELNYSIERILNFIKKHKYLAFYSDACWVDYSYEKQSLVRAFIFYYKYKFLDWWKKVGENWVDKKIINHINKVYIPDLKKEYPEAKAIIVFDKNSNGYKCYPRYEIIAYFEKCPMKCGCYDLGLTDKERNKINKIEKRLRFFNSTHTHSNVLYDCINILEW